MATRSADSTQGTTDGGRQPDNTSIIKAGGVDLLDLLKEGLVTPSRIINIRALPNMERIVNDATGLRIGALVTLAQIAADTNLQRSHTALVDAASHVATPQIRNVATIGGNLREHVTFAKYSDANQAIEISSGVELGLAGHFPVSTARRKS